MKLKMQKLLMEGAGDAGSTGGGAAGEGGGGNSGGNAGVGGDSAGASGAGDLASQIAAAGKITDAGSGSGDAGTGQESGDWLLDQYRVNGDDGTLDETQSAIKQAKAYQALSKRMRDGGAPPESPDEYKFEVPDELKESYKPDSDALLQGFRKECHEAGLTAKQYQMVMSRYAKTRAEIAEAVLNDQLENGAAELRKHWTTEDQFKENSRAVNAALLKFDPQVFQSDGSIKPEARGIMNNPYFVRFAAYFGSMIKEDTSPNTADNLPNSSQYRGMSLAELQNTDAYLQRKHPDHAVVSKIVQESYHKQTGEALPV